MKANSFDVIVSACSCRITLRIYPHKMFALEARTHEETTHNKYHTFIKSHSRISSCLYSRKKAKSPKIMQQSCVIWFFVYLIENETDLESFDPDVSLRASMLLHECQHHATLALILRVIRQGVKLICTPTIQHALLNIQVHNCVMKGLWLFGDETTTFLTLGPGFDPQPWYGKTTSVETRDFN